MLMLEVPNFKQKYLNSPKMEICEKYLKILGKSRGKIPKILKGVIAKVKIGLKKTVPASWFFVKIFIFSIPPPNTQKMRFLSKKY